MTKNYQDLTTALSAVYQAALTVHDIARGQSQLNSDLDGLLNSVFVTEPSCIQEVYPQETLLQSGKTALLMHVHPQKYLEAPQILRYVFDLLYLAKKLRKNKALSHLLMTKISSTKNKLDHFSVSDSNMIQQLGNIYLETISTLPYRIHVFGKPNVVQADFTAGKIRAVLLSGVRAAVLWYQLGGSRLHFYTKREKYHQVLEDMFSERLPASQI